MKKLFLLAALFVFEARAEDWVYLGGANSDQHCNDIAYSQGYDYYYFGLANVDGVLISNACLGKGQFRQPLIRQARQTYQALSEMRSDLDGDYLTLNRQAKDLWDELVYFREVVEIGGSKARIIRRMEVINDDFDWFEERFDEIHEKNGWDDMETHMRSFRRKLRRLEALVDELERK